VIHLPAFHRTACLLRSATLYYAINQTGAFIDGETITRCFFRSRYIIRNGEADAPMMPRVAFSAMAELKQRHNPHTLQK